MLITPNRLFIQLLPILIALAVCTQVVHATGTNPPAFDQHPKALEIANRLQTEHGLAAEQTLALIAQASFQPAIVRAVRPPASPTVRNWDTYRGRFVEPVRINKGIRFWNENSQTLQEAEAKFGIPQSVIVAIIGVETLYGEHIGNHRVIDALATLGFAYPEGQRDRSDFFQKELEAFLLLCSQTDLEPLEVKGSFAGAIGLGQFMPSSWMAYAVDGDGDGVIDLFHSRRDAIFSVANFLKVHGWEPGKAGRALVQVGQTEHLPTLLEPDIIPTFTASQMQGMGLNIVSQVDPDEKLALIELARGTGEPTYVLGGHNFYVVTRYNRSSFYANAVLELSESLERRRDLGK